MTTLDLEKLQSPDQVLELLYGSSLPESGVVHIAAVTRRHGVLRALRIQGNTPKSAFDFYALNAVRAWADVVLTSGKILRDEPSLSYQISGPTEAARTALRRWRGKRPPVGVAILSSGRGMAGPLSRWRDAARPVVFTSKEGARRLAEEGSAVEGSTEDGCTAEVEAVTTPTPRSLVRWACTRCGPSERVPSGSGRSVRVSVELGPSTSKALYQQPLLVDRLLLSEVLGEVPDDVVGGEFLPGFDLEQAFESCPQKFVDGRWVFRSFQRRGGSGPLGLVEQSEEP